MCRGVGRGGRRRRQLRRPGRRLPRRARAQGATSLIRGDDLYKNMSSYLAQPDRADAQHRGAAATPRSGGCTATATSATVEIVNSKTGEARTLQTPALFSFIGAVPRTDWLPPEIETDAKGFVRTGPAVAQSPHWTPRRQPFLLETSRPGVFAAGDVRVRLGQARRLGRRRGGDGGPVRPRVPEGDVKRDIISSAPGCPARAPRSACPSQATAAAAPSILRSTRAARCGGTCRGWRRRSPRCRHRSRWQSPGCGPPPAGRSQWPVSAPASKRSESIPGGSTACSTLPASRRASTCCMRSRNDRGRLRPRRSRWRAVGSVRR